MSFDPAPLSKTAKYKKITKPLLERKRRARINRCLDELKDLMVGALEIDDDNLSKLEKADILELTVNHLTKLHSPRDPVLEAKRFQAGFGQCAAEACRFISSLPDLDAKVSQNLISHLSRLITQQPLTIQVPERPLFSPPTSPSSVVSVVSDKHHYYSDHDKSSSDAEDSVFLNEGAQNHWVHRRPTANSQKPTQPMAGLLTTVDKLVVPHYAIADQMNGVANAQAKGKLNAVPGVILQKIRQHIMDKRGNETIGNVNMNAEPEPKYFQRGETYRGDFAYQYTTNDNDTLDLRKVRSPTKSAIETAHSPEKPTAYRSINQLDSTPSVQSKVDVAASLPEQCELPMDYSNLPPKKKRKLIEYQEYKKQEEARRRLDAFYAEKKERAERPPADIEPEDNWRPW